MKMGGGIIFNSIYTLTLSLFCVCETGPEQHKSAKHVSIINWVGMGGGDSTTSLENLPNAFCKKIRETLKSVRAIFDVFSRYRSIPGEHMSNFQNDKYDSGRTHPGIEKIKQCVRPQSTR
jgi:hypothetical protein